MTSKQDDYVSTIKLWLISIFYMGRKVYIWLYIILLFVFKTNFIYLIFFISNKFIWIMFILLFLSEDETSGNFRNVFLLQYLIIVQKFELKTN